MKEITLSSIIKKYDADTINLVDPLKVKLFLLKIYKNNEYKMIFRSEKENDPELNFLVEISTYLQFIEKEGDLTPLGFYFIFSTDYITDFFKFLMIQDKEFYSFCIELIESEVKIASFNLENISNFFILVPETIIEFFTSIDLLNIENGVNVNMLESWKVNYKIDLSNRIFSIFNNILKINYISNLEQRNSILDELGIDINYDGQLTKKIVKMEINFSEFDLFEEKLSDFYKILKDRNIINKESILKILELILEENLNQKKKSYYQQSIWIRNQNLKRFILTIYEECQLCHGKDFKIEPIIMKSGEKYLEIHHIIPISEQKNPQIWNQFYKLNNYKKAIFKNSLDHPANLICVCPYHHKMLHYGYPQWKFYIDKDSEYFFNGKRRITIKSIKTHYRNH